MRAGRYNINIEQGTDWELRFTWKDGEGTAIDLTGYTACMQVRAEHGAKAPVLEICDQELTGAEVLLQFTAAQTGAIKTDPKKLVWVDERQAQVMVYDIELKSPDLKTTRILQGAANVYPEVTQC